MTGENNPNYKGKEKVICNNCGKEFERIPALAKLTNSFGENHNFCCKECYWEFRKKYYVGDKLYNTGIKMSDEFCNKVRENTLKQYSNGILNRQTLPQKKINSILNEMNIKYINEKTFKYYSVDNYLEDYDLIIEIMGDYFHANPTIYNNYDTLNKMQKKDVIRDKRKNTYIKKYYNIDILYLWESDIDNNPIICKKLIEKYIKNKGKLDDYNSFNFLLYNDTLKLKTNIVDPYFKNNPLTTTL